MGSSEGMNPIFFPPTENTTLAYHNACLPTDRHFGVQTRALPVGLHDELDSHQVTCYPPLKIDLFE